MSIREFKSFHDDITKTEQSGQNLTAPHIGYTHNGINMADNMGYGEPHICEEKVQRDNKVRPDLISN